MYSWKTIRTLAAALLLVPIVHLAYLVSRETLLTLDNSPEAWADKVNAYARSDRLAQLPKDPIVIVGGRRVGLWQELEDILAPMAVLKRSIGDATTNDITHFHSDLIGFYRPHTVVFFPGESEFHIRDNKSAEELVEAIRALVELDLSYGITRHFYVFSPLKTPLYPSNNLKIDTVSKQLKAWANSVKELSILDANILLSDRSGSAKPGYFRSDGVHLNEHGYVRLSMMLRAQLEQDNPERYSLAQNF